MASDGSDLQSIYSEKINHDLLFTKYVESLPIPTEFLKHIVN